MLSSNTTIRKVEFDVPLQSESEVPKYSRMSILVVLTVS